MNEKKSGESRVEGREPEARSVAAICRRLRKSHGPVEWPEQWPVLDELVATILSQNTSDKNSSAAFEELRRTFADWDAVRRAPAAKIARAIRSGGLSKQKAPRIKAILQRIHEERGALSLEFLHDMRAPEAAAWLSAFPGVGPKTAACVLLFACRKPVLPVDTHVHRVSRRLGLIGQKVDAVKAHRQLAAMVPPRLVLEFHILLIRHGRTVCLAQRPKCEACPLFDLCPEGHRRSSTPSFPSSALRHSAP
ncbi:MAG: endonuclease III [Pirellulales bacterium]|nr:endonuclease III [Pirellulales bacterium]